MQRARILVAARETIEEVGCADFTVSAVIQRARLSRKTYYAIFANADECLEAVLEQIFGQACKEASSAYATEGGWLAGMRAALESVLGLVDERPDLARIWFVESLASSATVQAFRARANCAIAEAIDRGRALAEYGGQSSELTAEALVGAISHIIYTRLVDGSNEPFAALLGPMMYMVTLPYLGARHAQAELKRKALPRRHRPAPPVGRSAMPSLPANMRVTYRTVKALGVIAQQPGESNRAIAAECGIADQGQISKLLNRLQRLTLIENRGAGQRLGGSNAWHLTKRGAEILEATNAHPYHSETTSTVTPARWP